MKSINFRKFKFYTDISRERTVEQDVSRTLADHIYRQANGVMAHDLALRIYEKTEDIELTDEEYAFLEAFVAQLTPVFQDSFRNNLKETEK